MEPRTWEEIKEIAGKMHTVKVSHFAEPGQYISASGRIHNYSEATFYDYGPKLGVSRVFVHIPESTEAERAAGKERILSVCSGIINNIIDRKLQQAGAG